MGDKHEAAECGTEAPEAKANGGKRPMDPELKAMGVVDAQLTSLSEEQRRRVILWVVMKHRLHACFFGGCLEAPTAEEAGIAAA